MWMAVLKWHALKIGSHNSLALQLYRNVNYLCKKSFMEPCVFLSRRSNEMVRENAVHEINTLSEFILTFFVYDIDNF